MDINQFRLYIIRESLKTAGWWSQAIENLILGTGLVESGLSKFVQDGCGVARGVFQIEPKTYTDVISYIERDNDKVKIICTACNLGYLPNDVNAVIWNLRFAVLITRMFYYRIVDALPKSEDAQGMYQYYKKFYNSSAGAATEDRDLPIFKQVCSYKEI